MIMLLPLTPILIGIFVLGLSLLNKTSENIGTISTICLITVVIVSIVLFIYNFVRDAPMKSKIEGSVISIAATVMSYFETRSFFLIISSSSTSGILDLISFGFGLITGGGIWIGGVALCFYAVYHYYEEEDLILLPILALGGSFAILMFLNSFT